MGHPEAVEKKFVGRVPTAEGANDKGEDLTMFASIEKMLPEWLVFGDLRESCLFQGLRTIVKGTCYVDDEGAVFFFNNYIRAKREAGLSDSSVGDDVAKPGGVGYAGDKLVMAGTDVHEVGTAVA